MQIIRQQTQIKQLCQSVKIVASFYLVAFL